MAILWSYGHIANIGPYVIARGFDKYPTHSYKQSKIFDCVFCGFSLKGVIPSVFEVETCVLPKSGIEFDQGSSLSFIGILSDPKEPYPTSNKRNLNFNLKYHFRFLKFNSWLPWYLFLPLSLVNSGSLIWLFGSSNICYSSHGGTQLKQLQNIY